MNDLNISELIGKIILRIDGAEPGSDQILITCSDGCVYRMYHDQDCCESVSVDEVVGDLSDIIGNPILQSEEKTNTEDTFGKIEYPYSFTWTFYTIGTTKGRVDIKWLGESNGYYSESVYFARIGRSA